jgi:hypothetical protein
VFLSKLQGSPHLVNTGQHHFSFSWLKGKMSKNMEHFRRACTYFNVSFPATVCPHIFHKVNAAFNDLNIEYQTLSRSNYRKMGAPYTWTLQKKCSYWWKNTNFQKLTRWLKLCIWGGNKTISLKPEWKSHPFPLPGLMSPELYKICLQRNPI